MLRHSPPLRPMPSDDSLPKLAGNHPPSCCRLRRRGCGATARGTEDGLTFKSWQMRSSREIQSEGLLRTELFCLGSSFQSL